MGTYLIADITEDAAQLCDRCGATHRARFSTPHVTVSSSDMPGSGSHVVQLTMKATEGFKSLVVIPVVAGAALYTYSLLNMPHAVSHNRATNNGIMTSWFSVPSYLLTFLAISAVAPALVLIASAAVLDRQERMVADELELLVGRKRGSFTVLMPPRNWVLFPGDAELLLLAMGVLLIVNCTIWFAMLGRADLTPLLTVPYGMLMLGALAVAVFRNRARRAGTESLDIQAMERLNEMRLAGRMSYFFAFPLAFYAFISISRAIFLALSLAQVSMPADHGNSITISGWITINVGIPPLESEKSFDQYAATQILASSSLDLALAGVIVTAIVAYLSVFRHWTLIGINAAAAQRPTEHARPRGLPRSPAHAAKAALLAQWAFTTVVNLCGAAVIIITVLWLAHYYIYHPVIEDILDSPMSPLTWYKTVVALRLGLVTADTLLMLLIIPGALVLLVWAYSLFLRISLAVWLLLPVRCSNSPRLRLIKEELRRITGSPAPRIQVADWLDIPSTEAVLPFRWACVIRLPRHCIENLDDALLISVIAHEIVHVREHAKRLWLLEVMSWLSITGTGLLTSLLDPAEMEFLADEVAVRWTGDPGSAKRAIDYFQREEWAEASRKRTITRSAVSIPGSAEFGVARFMTAFFSFRAPRSGGAGASLQDRADRIASRSV